MDKPITRRQHGIAEALFIPALATAPNLAGFADDTIPANLARGASAAFLGLTLTTRAEWGLFKLIPYKAHLAVDVIGGLLAMSAPWLFGFSRNKAARNVFLAAGATAVVVGGLLSKPEEMPAGED